MPSSQHLRDGAPPRSPGIGLLGPGRGPLGLERRARAGRRGTVLFLVLLVSVTIGAASLGILLFTSQFTRRQNNAVHDQRAFYLAEAGLTEAYSAVVSGQPGQIGSIDRPARSGEGLFWVDATRNADGTVSLQSTALSGLGRASLSLNVERVEEPVGIFATNDIVVDAPLLLDGYDSGAGAYEDQVSLPSVTIPPDAFFHDNRAVMVLCIDWMFYEIAYVEGEAYYYQDTVERTQQRYTTYDARDYFDAKQAEGQAPAMVTTSVGGRLGTNGSISLSTPTGEPVAIFGDLVPGPGGRVTVGGGVTVTGDTSARQQLVELEPVVAPDTPLLPAVSYGGATPMVVPPSEVGYESLRILSNADLIVRGPSTLVVGDLELEDGAALFVENLDGPVDLFVLRSANLALGSIIEVESQDPADLTLRVVGAADPIQLSSTSAFHGMVYGPEAVLRVEAPFEVYGALIGGTLDLGANVRLHFDGGIAGNSGRLSLPKLISWDVAELPPGVGTQRISPLDALAIDESALQSVADAVVNYSWTAKVPYTSASTGEAKVYEGPFEEFLYEDVDSIQSFGLTPPDETFGGEAWTIEVDYADRFGTRQSWTGDVADYPYWSIRTLHERTLTPPPSLAAMGYEGSHYVRTP